MCDTIIKSKELLSSKRPLEHLFLVGQMTMGLKRLITPHFLIVDEQNEQQHLDKGVSYLVKVIQCKEQSQG